jgi:UDP-N-acetylmuramate--alanine ligase
VVCLDDPNVRAILPRVDRKLITYGQTAEADVAAADVRIDGFGSRYTVVRGGEELGTVRVPVPGRHAVQNSLAAVAVGLELDVAFGTIARALGRFPGVDRRFQHLGEALGATVIDDYGHHPTEIQAVLSAVREGFGSRTVVVFQPHRYSRTRALLEEFGRAFFLADTVVVTDVYAASETPIPGVDGAAVAEALRRHGHPHVLHVADLDDVPATLEGLVGDGDVLLTLGAGNVWTVGDRLVRSARRRAGAKRSRTAARKTATKSRTPAKTSGDAKSRARGTKRSAARSSSTRGRSSR